MEERQLEIFIITLLAGTAVSILTGIFLQIRGYFCIQPKVKVLVRGGLRSTTPLPGEQMNVSWLYTIRFMNETTYDAINFNIKCTGIPENCFSAVKEPHIKALSDEYIELTFNRVMMRQEFSVPNPAIELIPADRKQLRMIAEYKNAKNKRFYTRYYLDLSKDLSSGTISYHKKRPKFKKRK